MSLVMMFCRKGFASSPVTRRRRRSDRWAVNSGGIFRLVPVFEAHAFLHMSGQFRQIGARDQERREREEILENAVLAGRRRQVIMAGGTAAAHLGAEHALRHQRVAVTPE